MPLRRQAHKFPIAARHDFLQDCTGLAGQSCHVSQTASVVTGSSRTVAKSILPTNDGSMVVLPESPGH
jgi:hypothetical protein